MKPISVEQSIKTGQSCACFNLRKATRVTTQIYDEALRPAGIRANQFSIMMAVVALEPVTIKKLAETLMMDRTTMGRNIKPLESKGLIDLKTGDDRRERHVSLTPRGHKALTQAYPLWEDVQQKLTSAIGDVQFGSLLSLLQLTSAVGA